jgi:hypothetical protein
MNWIFILLLAISIEVLTVFVRFAFKIKTRDVLFKIMKRFGWKKIVHFHHGFVGIIILIVAYYLGLNFWVDVGLGVLISDAIHHFLVLWPIMGSPEFHVVYKNIGEMEKEEKLEKKEINKVVKKLVG